MQTITVINGPNLNLIGSREKDIYGSASLESILSDLSEKFKGRCQLEFIQSNGEGILVDAIQQLMGQAAGIVINAGAYTHTSIAIRDALLAVEIPFVEVHLSNVYAREEFRQRSLLSDRALGVVCGFGAAGYWMAVEGLLQEISGHS